MSIKKSLTDDGEETTIKVPFTGKENIFEVKDKLQKMIAENKSQENENVHEGSSGFNANGSNDGHWMYERPKQRG